MSEDRAIGVQPAEGNHAPNGSIPAELLTITNDMAFVANHKGSILFANALLQRRLGYRQEELLGRAVLDLRPPEFKEQAAAYFGEILAGNRKTCPLPFQTKGGALLHVESRILLGEWAGEQAVFCIAKDVAERDAARQALLASEERFRILSENLHEFVCEQGPDGRFVYASPNYEVLAGYPVSELLGKTAVDFVHPEDRISLARVAQDILQTGQDMAGIQYRVRYADGSEHWMESDVKVLRATTGDPHLCIVSRDITDRKRAEDSLRRSEQLFRNIFNLPLVGMAITSPEQEWIAVNDKLCEILGYTREELFQLRWPDITHPDDIAAEQVAYERVLEVGSVPKTIEKRYLHKDGAVVHVNLSTARLNRADGSLEHYVSIFEDITKRKQAEEAIRESETRYRQLFDRAPLGIFHFDEQGIIRACNDTFLQIIGTTRDVLLGFDMLSRVQNPGVHQSIQDAIDGKTGYYRGEYQSVSASRTTFVQMYTYMLRSPDGQFLGNIGMVEDLTTQNAAEEALKASEFNYRHLFEFAVDGILIGNQRGEIVQANGKVLQMTGYSLEELLGNNIQKLFYPEDLHSAPLRYDLLNQNQSVRSERRLLRKDGSLLSIEMNTNQLPDGRYQTFMRDISDRKEAEQIIREGEERFRALCTHTTDNIFWIGVQEDGSFVVEGINPALEADLHCTSEQIAGKALMDFLPSEVAVPLIANYRRCLDGRGPLIYEETRTLEGITKTYETLLVPIADQSGRYYRIVGTSRDISESINTAEALRQTQKLESLGVLAGGIAHDFNNLLTALMGNLNLAQVKINPESPALPHIEAMERIILRASDLTKQMLAYSGRGRFVVKPHDLNEVVKEMAHLLHVSISKKIVLRQILASNLPSIDADGAQIQQVIMNLVTNASDAIGDQNGIIRISTRMQALDADFIRANLPGQTIQPGDYVALEVSDTGCGMSRETLTRIFDPFFTTKTTGRGLGLSAMLGILRGHHAGIQIHSEVNKGTTFQIFFPASLSGAAPTPSKQPPRNVEFNGTVLVVDDEPVIQDATGAALRAMGFEVITAMDGLEAIQVYKEHQEEIRVVILDLTMPRMDGREAFEELHRINPKVKAILTSGYSESDSVQELLGKGLAAFVQKPYRLREMKEAISKCLDQA